MKIRIKIGDLVKVLTGSEDRKGGIGKVLEIDRKKMRIKIEGIAPIKRHVKPQKSKTLPEGGIVSDFGMVHISNVIKVEG